MPAQWPTFINNVSNKLSSLSASSIDEFAVFFANEYFNSVKTSQTMYGNIHQSGQKPILEEGFKKAFKKIYDEETIEFDSKFTNSRYADLFEKAPGPDTNFDALCELEKWTDENKENLEKFIFYPLFKSTCPIETPPPVFGEIDFNLLEEAEKPGEPQKYVTMSISGFTAGIDYKFLYSINGVDQPIQIATDDVLIVPIPIQDGTYKYVFKAVYDADGVSLLKEINKEITLIQMPDGVEVIEEVKDPFADKKPRQTIPELTEDEKIEAIANRILYQNDGSKDFKKWVDRLKLGYNQGLGLKISKKVFKIVEPYYKTEEAKIKNKANKNTKNAIREKIPTIDMLGLENTLNQYIFQSEHIDLPDSIPDWLIPNDYICKFTYIKKIDSNVNNKAVGFLSENNRIKSKEKLYQEEKKKWWELLRKWGNSQTGNLEEETISGDGYDVMAQTIIDYWKSTAIQPFKPGPPIPPCTSIPPLGGKYAPISYGNKNTLANDLRRAWNTGKRFKIMTLTPVASKSVASAVAVSCAKHLLGVKFLYLGGLIIPVGPPIPMVGISPTTF